MLSPTFHCISMASWPKRRRLEFRKDQTLALYCLVCFLTIYIAISATDRVESIEKNSDLLFNWASNNLHLNINHVFMYRTFVFKNLLILYKPCVYK